MYDDLHQTSVGNNRQNERNIFEEEKRKSREVEILRNVIHKVYTLNTNLDLLL